MKQQTDQALVLFVGLLKGGAESQRDRISEFQRHVWSMDESGPAEEILREVAYDLDYFEEDSNARIEDPSFYGPERLAREIAGARAKLERCGVLLPRFERCISESGSGGQLRKN